MLRSRNLDDQTFDSIMDYALERLPWLCPDWTDYNAHDPGITIVELLAWYKEMQQYHLNVVSPALRMKLLKLLGVQVQRPAAATCNIILGHTDKRYPPLSRLESPEDIPMEITERISPCPNIGALYVCTSDSALDLTSINAEEALSFHPFDVQGEASKLVIAVDNTQHENVRFFVDVEDEYPIKRNPFSPTSNNPRTLCYRALGTNEELTVVDETHAMSHSGFITVNLPKNFPLTDGGFGLKQAHYISIEEKYSGCEERVRLRTVQTGYYRASQQETWAKCTNIEVDSNQTTIFLEDALSKEGAVYAFMKKQDGYDVAPITVTPREDGATVALECVPDEKTNFLFVSFDPVKDTHLMFETTGLADLHLDFPLAGRRLLSHDMKLMVDTVCSDGVIRPALFSYTDDMSSASEHARVFTFDPIGEKIIFGDGHHGVIPAKSERGALVVSCTLSYCENGNIPQNCSLVFGDGTKVCNTPAFGGCKSGSIEEASLQFLKRLENSKKCASVLDYERLAKSTPGLRVSAVRAIAGYDRDEPTGNSRIPVISVAVAPYNGEQRPLPDAQFIGAIQAYLDEHRPICTRVKIIEPRYAPISAHVQIRAKRENEKAIRDVIEEYLQITNAQRGIGDTVSKKELMALIMKLPEVEEVQRLDLNALGTQCRVDARGDIMPKPDAVPYLKSLTLQVYH